MMLELTFSAKTVTLATFSLEKTPNYLVSDNISRILQWILYTTLCQLTSVFGICTNIVNIICFVRQGFKEPVNVSLTGLAVADLGSLITILWTNICFNPDFIALDLPFEANQFQYLTSGIPHTIFTRISGWITALITLEKCVCISAPFKAKSTVTTKRMSVIVVCFFVIIPAAGSPVYVVNSLNWKFFPHRNKTLIGIVSTDNREEVELISYMVNNFYISLSSFLIVVVSTVILAAKLGKKSEWLKASTANSQADKLSNRNQKVAKMVLMISTLFIVCFLPNSALFLAMSIESDISFENPNRNIFVVCGGICLVLESFNSSGNIFLYFHMSTKYRKTFGKIFKATLRI